MKSIRKYMLYALLSITALAVVGMIGIGVILNQVDIQARSKQIAESLARKSGVQIFFKSVGINLFPLPDILLEDVNLIMPEKADLTVQQVRIRPKISALFLGKFTPAVIVLDGSRSIVDVGALMPEKPDRSPPLSMKGIMEKLIKVKDAPLDSIPAIRLRVIRGRISLVRKDQQSMWISVSDADVRLSAKTVKIDAECSSDLWQYARFNMSIHPEAMSAKGRISIEDLRLMAVENPFIPASSLPVSRLQTSFDMDFNVLDFSTFYGAVQGRIPELVITGGKDTPVHLSVAGFKGGFHFADDRITVSVSRLDLNHPQAKLSGRFMWDRKKPDTRLDIEGSVEGVAEARQASLALVSRFKTTRRLFAVIRDGVVPRITFSARAESPKKFKRAENIYLTGEMHSGTIVTPGSHLELTDVSGEVTLSGGFLKGKNIRARLGNSTGSEGAFSIGVFSPTAPMYVETQVDADLSQLPPILARVIKSDAVKREMGMLKNTTGRATGKLILSGPKKGVKPEVLVDKFSVRLQYQRTPYDISLDGGRITYEDKRFVLTDVSVRMGQSLLTGLDAAIDWHGLTAIDGTAENLSLNAPEIFTWAKTFDNFSDGSIPWKLSAGTIDLSRSRVKGPLFHPNQWEFSTTGNVRDLEITVRETPDMPFFVSGGVAATHHRVDMPGGLLIYGENCFQGDIAMEGYLGDEKAFFADFHGDITPRILSFFFPQAESYIDMSSQSKWRISEGRFNWHPGKNILFTGNISIPDGPNVFLDISQSGDGLFVNGMHITDDDADAFISLSQKEGECDIRFNGHLGEDATASLLNAPPSIAGDFTLDINACALAESIFSGNAEITNLDLSRFIDFPAVIQTAGITGTPGGVIIRARGKIEGESQFDIEGELSTLKDDVSGRFDVLLDKLDVNAFINHIRQNRNDAPKAKGRFYKTNFTWDLDITADAMDFGKYSWSRVAAHAAVSPETIQVDIKDALMCGIRTPGAVTLEPDWMRFQIEPRAEKSLLQDAVPCLGGKSGLIEGEVDVSGIVLAHGAYNDIWPKTNGDFTLAAKNGRIYRFSLMAKIFTVLNITEIFRGTLPDLTREGFQYNSIEIEGTVSGQKIIITKGVIDGMAMDMFFNGEINAKTGALDISLLVAPLKTVDFIVKKTPILKQVLDGSLVTIAIDIDGDIASPEVTPLPPSAIGGGLLKIIGNTFKLPVTIIKPVIDQTKETQHGTDNRQD